MRGIPSSVPVRAILLVGVVSLVVAGAGFGILMQGPDSPGTTDDGTAPGVTDGDDDPAGDQESTDAPTEPTATPDEEDTPSDPADNGESPSDGADDGPSAPDQSGGNGDGGDDGGDDGSGDGESTTTPDAGVGGETNPGVQWMCTFGPDDVEIVLSE